MSSTQSKPRVSTCQKISVCARSGEALRMTQYLPGLAHEKKENLYRDGGTLEISTRAGTRCECSVCVCVRMYVFMKILILFGFESSACAFVCLYLICIDVFFVCVFVCVYTYTYTHPPTHTCPHVKASDCAQRGFDFAFTMAPSVAKPLFIYIHRIQHTHLHTHTHTCPHVQASYCARERVRSRLHIMAPSVAKLLVTYIHI
jgi:hypothetical protein